MIVSPVDAAALDRILSDNDDVAAVIVESNGAHYGTFPLMNPDFLHDVQEVTSKHGVLFVMDEVITGFRLSPGGAQGALGSRPGPDDDGQDSGRRAAGCRGRRGARR